MIEELEDNVRDLAMENFTLKSTLDEKEKELQALLAELG